MTRSERLLCLGTALALAALAGCGGRTVAPPVSSATSGRPDEAMHLEARTRSLNQTDLDFQDARVSDVVARMEAKFGCRIRITPAAARYLQSADPRITARLGEVPANLAFEACRAQLEMKGLVLQASGNALGRPGYVLDRSLVREATMN